MIIDFIYIFMIMGAGQGFLMGIHLLSKKQNKIPNKLLGILMIAFALNLLDVFLIVSGQYVKYPHLLGITSVFPYVYGPLMFLFAKSTAEKLEKLSFGDYLHLLPFVILMIIGLPLYFLKSAEFKMGMAAQTVDAPILSAIGMFIPVVGVFYVYLSSGVLLKYRRRIKQSFSNIDQINLEWLQHFIWGNGIVWLFVIIAYSIQPILPDWFMPNLIIYIPVASFLFWIGYISLSKQSSYLVNSADVLKLPQAPAYSKSGLTDEQANSTVGKLISLVEEKKLYKESSLKLQDLSDALEVPAHHLTEVLNTKVKQNFYDFINSYRVEEVKVLIENDPEKKYNLLSLALDAGFSSKSSFNSIFKKHTGLTPSEYRSKSLKSRAA